MDPCDILVVDATDQMRDLLASELARHGYAVEVAADGVEALEWLEHRSCRVVLTDLRMPRMGGEELIQRLRDRGPPPLIVAMTADYEPPAAALIGADAMLAKPFELTALLQLLVDHGCRPRGPRACHDRDRQGAENV